MDIGEGIVLPAARRSNLSLRDEFIAEFQNGPITVGYWAKRIVPWLEQKLADTQAATVERCMEHLDRCAETLTRQRPEWELIQALKPAMRALSPDPEWLSRQKKQWESEVLKKAIGKSPLLVRGGYEDGEFLVDHVIADSVSIADLDHQLAALSPTAADGDSEQREGGKPCPIV